MRCLMWLAFFASVKAYGISLPSIPSMNLTFPYNPLLLSAFEYIKAHASVNTANHCARSAYFALILAKRHPDFIGKQLNMEAVLFSAIMHDMGWATDKSLLSKDRRFEVDGADIARAYLKKYISRGTNENVWDENQIQLVWDTIALHTTPSIGMYKEPEVRLTSLGITSDVAGPNVTGGFITLDEYKAVVALFPRVHFKDEFIQILCGLCRDKPATTFDNVVGEFGLLYGLDGNGLDQDKYRTAWMENRVAPRIVAGLESVDSLLY